MILFALATIGLAMLIRDSVIFEPIRLRLSGLPVIAYVIDCPQCLGTWCGLVIGALLLSHEPVEVLCAGFAGSYLVPLAYQVSEFLLSNETSHR